MWKQSLTAMMAAISMVFMIAPAYGVPSKAGYINAGEAADLTETDVNAWLDGMMPYALATGDIAGAVVVVVKDGEILTQRGFGYSDVETRIPIDPKVTGLRPGSISKLFGATAAMQLVEAGKLDLDRDVNEYLDFKIPDAFDKPITLKHLLTHTAGFEDRLKYLIATDPSTMISLGDDLKRQIPPRIFAPGTTPSYSNYGAALVGYIVQQVSGESFEDYIANHIFKPLEMNASTFEQPLPERFAANMSKGYNLASQPAQEYELVGLAPAGALLSTGEDMGKFMLAYLDQGGVLLKPITVRKMLAPANTPIEGMPSMSLGFYHIDHVSETIVAHGGDTILFHSDLHLYTDSNVGIFATFTSNGKDAATYNARELLFSNFGKRYFPQEIEKVPTQETANAHGKMLSGSYISTRASITNWVKVLTFAGATQVELNEDDTITVSNLLNVAGVPKRWREVAPWQWIEVGGESRLNAVVENGQVVRIASIEFSPIMVFIPAPFPMNQAWLMPLLIASFGIVFIAAITWPITALVRLKYKYRSQMSGKNLWLKRASRITSWLFVIVAISWLFVLTWLSADLLILDGRLDGPIRFIQLLTILGLVGTILTIWNAYSVIRDSEQKFFAASKAVLMALSVIMMGWFFLNMNTLTLALNY